MEDSKTYFIPENNSGLCSMIAPLLQQRGIDPNVFAMMSNNGFGNNGVIWLLFLLVLFNNNGNGFGNNNGNLLNAVNDNSSRDLLMQAINGNGNAIGQLSTKLNCDTNSIINALNTISSNICQVGNQVGLTSQQVINSIQQGNMSLTQQMCNCCCGIKENITKMGYENQLATANQTNTLNSRIDQLANGVQTGFASVGYAAQTNTNAIIQANNSNTQRIVDLLNNHWTSDLQQRYNDARLELSQSAQNAYLISQLKTT